MNKTTWKLYNLDSMGSNVPEILELNATTQEAAEQEVIETNRETWLAAFGRLPIPNEDFRLEVVIPDVHTQIKQAFPLNPENYDDLDEPIEAFNYDTGYAAALLDILSFFDSNPVLGPDVCAMMIDHALNRHAERQAS